MEYGFSSTPHHGPGSNDGADTTYKDDPTTTNAAAEGTAAATTAANEQHDVTVDEPEHVKDWLPPNQYKRQKEKLKKCPITVVFNESNLTLTKGMIKVLNRGLKFSILPLKLDLTQTLTEFRRFERTMVWSEVWYGRDTEETYVPPIFKQKKSNFPRNYRAPRGLQDYLAAVRSEICDPKNRHKVDSNITEEEKDAI